MKLLILSLLLTAGTVHAEQFLCKDNLGRRSLVEPDLSKNVVTPGNYVDCIRQDANDQNLFVDIVFKPKKKQHHRARGFGRQCFSFYCGDCPHGSTTGGYPMLFGYCYQ